MRKKFVFILASVLLLCLLYFSFHLISKISLKRKHQSNVERLLSEADMKSGDLIFRKGRSLRSRVVLVVDQECDYSHVGLVYLTDDNTYVIHAVPGETEGKVNYVKKEKIEDFLSFQKAKKTVIYR